MKNPAKTGNSVRNGNAPAPYTKYDKRPMLYGGDAAREKAREAVRRGQAPRADRSEKTPQRRKEPGK